MAEYLIQDQTLTNLADVIRAKIGTTNKISVNEMITNIDEKLVDTTDATGTANDVLINKTVYINGEKVTGNIPIMNAEDATITGNNFIWPSGYYPNEQQKSMNMIRYRTGPTISVAEDGLITSTIKLRHGYTPKQTLTATQQLPYEVWRIELSDGSIVEKRVVV